MHSLYHKIGFIRLLSFFSPINVIFKHVQQEKEAEEDWEEKYEEHKKLPV